MYFARNFGRVVREYRENRKLTIEQAAELCGMSTRGYENIELGDSDPKLSNVLSIAKVFDIDLGKLNVCLPLELN